MEGKKYFATGKRKTSVARVWMEPGSGSIIINKKPMDEYFRGLEIKKKVILQPLELTNFAGKFNVHVNVHGGGIKGQAEAIRHAIARTLLTISPETRPELKEASLLTRDDRKTERKKYGLKGARKRFQYSKR